MLNGLLNVDKPAGITSRAVVDRIVRLTRQVKAGHAGTLDPLAAGVLVVCLGKATRLMQYVQQLPKTYHAVFLLGRESPTEDLEGEVRELADPPIPSIGQIAEAASHLTGWIEQKPPAFSAVRVEGRRAYTLARKGRPVQPEPRRIRVHGIEVEGYGYPELRLRIECSSGTYVRSLGRDLALSLGTAAVMSRLVRTAIGAFRIEDAVDLDRLTPENCTQHLLNPWRAVERLPRIKLSADETARVRSGQKIPRPIGTPETRELAAMDPAGRLLAILVPYGEGLLKPARNLLSDG